MDIDFRDQKSIHQHEQNFYDQRTQQQLNVVQMGVVPLVAQEREAQLRANFFHIVPQLQQQSQDPQMIAEVSLAQT